MMESVKTVIETAMKADVFKVLPMVVVDVEGAVAEVGVVIETIDTRVEYLSTKWSHYHTQHSY